MNFYFSILWTNVVLIESPVIGGCTIPGCYYPHFFSHHVNASVIKSMRVRGGRLSCQHMDIGTPLSRIECRLKCKKGWENANDIDVTVCTKSQVEALATIKNLTSHTSQTHRALHQKTTNFTTDYLECHRRISLTSPSYHESTTRQSKTILTKLWFQPPKNLLQRILTVKMNRSVCNCFLVNSNSWFKLKMLTKLPICRYIQKYFNHLLHIYPNDLKSINILNEWWRMLCHNNK